MTLTTSISSEEFEKKQKVKASLLISKYRVASKNTLRPDKEM